MICFTKDEFQRIVIIFTPVVTNNNFEKPGRKQGVPSAKFPSLTIFVVKLKVKS
jgi:hypothetical protein